MEVEDQHWLKSWQSVSECTSYLHSFANKVLDGEDTTQDDLLDAFNQCLQLYKTIENCTMHKRPKDQNSVGRIHTMDLHSFPDLKNHNNYAQSVPQLKDDVPGLRRKRQRSLSQSNEIIERQTRPKLTSNKNLSSGSNSPVNPLTDNSNAVPCTSDKEKDSVMKRKRRSRAPAPFCDNLFCHSCGETQTSEWRRGPDGFKSLCNACGLHYAAIVKKEKLVPSSAKKITLDMLLNTDEVEEELEKSTNLIDSSSPLSSSSNSSDDSLSPREDFKTIFNL